MNLHHTLYVFMHLFVQVSWVASKQPDDPPKCWIDERTWVCVLSSQVLPCFTRSSSLFLFKWYHWNFYDNKDILLNLFKEWIILLMPFYFLQNGGDGASHPVHWPICHAGGDGCIYSFEEGSLKSWLPDESSLTKPVSKNYFLPPCSGCFCSSTHHGTVPLSSFLLMPMRGSANAGQVPSGHTVENNYLDKYCYSLFDRLQCLGLPCRPVWEGTLPEHRGGRALSYSVQICSSPVHHQRSGIRTHPGKR